MMSFNLDKGARLVDKLLFMVSGISIFSYLALYGLVSNGYSYGPFLVFVCAVTTIWFSRCRSELLAEDWLIIFSLFYFALTGMALMLLHGFSSSGLDRLSKFLFAAISLVFVLRYPPPPSFFWSGVFTGALLLGVYAILQVVRKEIGLPTLFFDYTGVRVRSAHNAIYFGNSALILGLFCLAGMKWALHQRRKKLWLVAMLLGFILGFAGSLLSGTRSGWVTVPFAFLVLMRVYKEQFSCRQLLAFLVFGMLAIMLILAIPQTRVYDRVYLVYENIHDYYVNNNPETSIGYRIDMWKSGIKAFGQSPLTGLGGEGYDIFEAELIEQGEVAHQISRWRHLHNQYIDTMAKQGLVGLLALLIVFFVPLRLFYSRSSSDDPVIRSLAAAGMIFMIAYIDINLTQSLFARNIGVMKFVFMVIFIWGIISALERKQQRTAVS